MNKAISPIHPIYDPIQPLDGKTNSPTFVLWIFSPVLCSLFYVSQLPRIIGPYPDYSAVKSWIINEHVVCFGTPADLFPLTHWWLITGVDMEWQLTAFILSIFVTVLENNDKGKKDIADNHIDPGFIQYQRKPWSNWWLFLCTRCNIHGNIFALLHSQFVKIHNVKDLVNQFKVSTMSRMHM